MTNRETSQAVLSPRDDQIRCIALNLLLFVLLAGVTFLQYRKNYQGLRLPQAMENAQLARNIVQGNGFRTNVIRPIGLARNSHLVRNVGEEIRSDHPDMMNPPVFPLVTALLFALGGARDLTASLASFLACVLTGLMTYLLARRLFNARIALWSVAVFWILPSTITLQFAGIAAPWAAFVTTALFWMLAGLRRGEEVSELEEPGPRPLSDRTALGMGALFGLCYLSQYSLIALTLPILVYLYIMQRPRATRPIALFLIGFIAVTSLWMLRNLRVAHNPVFSLHQYEMMAGTSQFAGESVYRYWENVGQPVIYSITHPKTTLKRMIVNTFQMYQSFPNIVGIYLMPLFLITLLLSFRQPLQDRLKMLIGACLAFFALNLSFVKADTSLLFALTPALMIYGLTLPLRLIESLRLKPLANTLISAFFFVWLLFPTAAQLALGAAPQRDPLTPAYETLREQPARVVITDMPWSIAWQTNRIAIWLPVDSANFCRQMPAVEGILLTAFGGYNDPDTALWGQALQSIVSLGAPTPQQLRSLTPEQRLQLQQMQTEAVKRVIPVGFADPRVQIITQGQRKQLAYVLWTRSRNSAASQKP